MSDREELDALRRMAELEAKASGSSAVPPVPIPTQQTGNMIDAVAEPILKLGSGIIAKPAGDIAGLAKGGYDAARRFLGYGQQGPNAEETQRAVQGAIQYEPTTKVGSSNWNPLNAIPNAVAAGINLLQPDAATGEDSTTMAGMLRNGIREFIPQVIGIAGVKSAAPVTKAVKTVTTPVVNTVAARFGSQPAITERASAALKSAAEGNEPFAIKAMDNAKTFVPGATPTMAEAIAGAQEPNSIQGGRLVALQRSMRGAKGVEDIVPSAEQAQKAALEGSLAPYAGGADAVSQTAALETAKALRGSVAENIYGLANSADKVRRSFEADQALKNSGGIQQMTPAEMPTVGLQSLAKRPAFQAAMKEAGTSLENSGAVSTPLTSLDGLHRIKLSIDDALQGKNPQSALAQYDKNSLLSIKSSLLKEMEEMSSMYKKARTTFAEMSEPINQLQVNQTLANKLTNTSDALTPSQFLTAADTGEAALLKKSGIPRYAGGLSDVLTPENMATVEGIANHLGRTQKAQQMSAAVQTGTESALPPIPHVGGKAIILDSIRRAINGKNVNTAVAQAMTDPAKVAELLRMPKGNTPGTFGPLGLGVQFVPQPDQKALAAQLRKQQ